MSKRAKIIIIVAVVLLAASSRLIDHPYNFTPIVAMSLFAGCYLGKKWLIFLPLSAMLLSDFLIGFYHWQVMAAVYISIALAFFIGRFLSGKLKWYNVGFSAIASSYIFFFVTNFSVWLFFDWYPKTWAGLINCFYLAIPFFRNSLAGDLFYTVVLFSVFELVLSMSKKRSLAAENIKKQVL